MDGGYIVANDECVLLMLSLYSVGTWYCVIYVDAGGGFVE